MAFATTFEAGLQVSIRTITRHVTSLKKKERLVQVHNSLGLHLVAVVAEVGLIAVLGQVAGVVALEAPRLFLSAIFGKVATSVTLQTPQAALFRPSSTSGTVSGKVSNLVAEVTLQSGCVLLLSAGVNHCPSNWSSTSWQSASANSS